MLGVIFRNDNRHHTLMEWHREMLIFPVVLLKVSFYKGRQPYGLYFFRRKSFYPGSVSKCALEAPGSLSLSYSRIKRIFYSVGWEFIAKRSCIPVPRCSNNQIFSGLLHGLLLQYRMLISGTMPDSTHCTVDGWRACVPRSWNIDPDVQKSLMATDTGSLIIILNAAFYVLAFIFSEHTHRVWNCYGTLWRYNNPSV